MKHPNCPDCLTQDVPSELRSVKADGSYYRKSDRKHIRRFKCLVCERHFSKATSHPAFRQRKRQLNFRLWNYLCSGMSQRRAAKLLSISRTTVARKLCYLGAQAQVQLESYNRERDRANTIQFDDLETFEHTKCKPLSITLAVEEHSRRILGFEVSQMPANGPLAHISRQKYGPRPDQRSAGRDALFKRLEDLVEPISDIKSDQNPHYPPTVKKHFPKARHLTFKGRRGAIVGQGELKKIGFDPIFSLNHTCAMFRANVNRLFRKTWCTTKKPERLRFHLSIYAIYHNTLLI